MTIIAPYGFMYFQNTFIYRSPYSAPGAAPPAPSNGAMYRLLLPHTFGSRFYDQGSVVTDGIDTPFNWVPTLAVDPLNNVAVTQYYAAGPRGLGWESLARSGLENYFPQPLPVTFWVNVAPNLAQLTGLGASLPPKIVS